MNFDTLSNFNTTLGNWSEEPFSREELRNTPQQPGVYVFTQKNKGSLLYVGETANFRNRLPYHEVLKKIQKDGHMNVEIYLFLLNDRPDIAKTIEAIFLNYLAIDYGFMPPYNNKR